MTSPCSPDPPTDWPSAETTPTTVTSSGIVNNASKIDEPVEANEHEQQQQQQSEEGRKEWRLQREMSMSVLKMTEEQLDDLNLELKEAAASLSLALSLKNDLCGRPQRDFDYLLLPKSMSANQEDALVTESN